MHIHVGTTTTPGGEAPFYLDLSPNQFRHGWLLGKSGTGKSTLLRNTVVEAIRQGMGVEVIDPHGDLIFDILNYIPQSRLKDVIYLDPESNRAPDLGIFDHPDKEKAIQAFMSIMEGHAGKGWGPETAHIFRSATDAVIETHQHPTILPIYKILVREKYARSVLSKSKNPLVMDFYEQYFSKDVKPRDRMSNFSHPLNKIEELLRPGLREFLCQKRSLNFVSIMDRQKILLCRIPKGIMGERPAKVLGSLILSKTNLATFRRKKRSRPFLVVVDEIHNFVDGIDFEAMLAESRKYGVSYLFATQTSSQLRDEEKRRYYDRVAFGNCSNIFSFRVGGDDSEQIARNFGNVEIAQGLVNLPDYEFRAWTISDHEPILSKRVLLLDKPEMRGDEVPARKAIAWASQNTGTPKRDIERQILAEMGR